MNKQELRTWYLAQVHNDPEHMKNIRHMVVLWWVSIIWSSAAIILFTILYAVEHNLVDAVFCLVFVGLLVYELDPKKRSISMDHVIKKSADRFVKENK